MKVAKITRTERGIEKKIIDAPSHVAEKRSKEILEEEEQIKSTGYIKQRRAEYPPEGEAADIAYKQRQKARMQIGKARQALEDGDIASALVALMEAVEPVEDAKDYDGQVSAVKKKYPKPDKEKSK